MKTIKTVGVLSPGDMGHSIGNVLRENGLRVITCLEGRSDRTRRLAAEAGIAAVPTYADLVQEADLLLSVLVPAQAPNAAARVAEELVETGVELAYADCNAIAPQTAKAIGERLTEAGATFIDASIIGGPPRRESRPRMYVSGPDTSAMEALNDYGMNVTAIGEEVGLASAIKMCYAAWTKGSTALVAELLVAAKALGVFGALEEEFRSSQSAMLMRMQSLPAVPIKSRRFVGEMIEISKAFGAIGMTPKMLQGAAEVYQFIGDTHLADRTPEDTSPMPTLEETLAILVGQLPEE